MASRSLRVLLVDPFHDESEMYQASLRLDGFDVHAVADVAEARDAALTSAPDVIVARLRQIDPDMSGVELARLLKAEPTVADVPIVIITTSIRPVDRTDAAAAGCDSYILLPCDPGELAVELRRVVAEVRARRAGTEGAVDGTVSLGGATSPGRTNLRH